MTKKVNLLLSEYDCCYFYCFIINGNEIKELPKEVHEGLKDILKSTSDGGNLIDLIENLNYWDTQEKQKKELVSLFAKYGNEIDKIITMVDGDLNVTI